MQFLDDVGLFKYSHQAVDYVQRSLLAVDKYAQRNYPELYQIITEGSQLYIKLLKDVGLVVYNQFESVKIFAIGKYPVVLETVRLENYLTWFTVNVKLITSIMWFVVFRLNHTLLALYNTPKTLWTKQYLFRFSTSTGVLIFWKMRFLCKCIVT